MVLMHVDILGPVDSLTPVDSSVGNKCEGGVWFQTLPQGRRPEQLSRLCCPSHCSVIYFPCREKGENKFITEAGCLQVYLCMFLIEKKNSIDSRESFATKPDDMIGSPGFA